MTWSAAPSLNYPREGLAAATAPSPTPATGSRLYAIGGDDGNDNMIPQVEAYDPLTRTWEVLDSALPSPRTNLAAATVNGRVHVLGGSVTGPLATHDIYDPATGAWSTGAPVPTERAQLAAVTGPDGSIYVLGGVNGPPADPAYLATLEIYDPTTGTWSTGPSMPTARAGLAAGVIGGLIYALGGTNDMGNVPTVEVLDPVAGMWGTVATPLPVALSRLAASTGPDGLLYAVGGVDNFGEAQSAVYSYDPATGLAWSTQPSLATPQGLLAAANGPDGLLYAIGGRELLTEATVEVLDIGEAQPDPYIGNGTYQSPDIILLDSSGQPVQLGGAPGGAWDTLLLPNTDYTIQAVISNDTLVPAPNTIVRFWHFPGGVGTAGTLIDAQYVTVPATSSMTATATLPFHSAPAGQHDCVAVSVANPQSPYFNVDPTAATDVVNPTVPQPSGSNHFGSAWRNTNSIVVRSGAHWGLGFVAGLRVAERHEVAVSVSAVRVPAGWDRARTPTTVQRTLQCLGAQSRMPLFLLPEVRAELDGADIGLEIRDTDTERAVACSDRKHVIHVGSSHSGRFTVSGTIPPDACPGDIYLVDISAHYPAGPGRAAASVGFLEVLYVR